MAEKLGISPSQNIFTCSGSLFARLAFSSLSSWDSIQPGILTIGIPTSEVTGGYIGTAMDGSVIHRGVVGMFISRILIGLISRPTKGIISLQNIFE